MGHEEIVVAEHLSSRHREHPTVSGLKIEDILLIYFISSFTIYCVSLDDGPPFCTYIQSMPTLTSDYFWDYV